MLRCGIMTVVTVIACSTMIAAGACGQPAPTAPPATEPAPGDGEAAFPKRAEPGSRTIPPLDRGGTLFRNVHIITMTDAGVLRNRQVLVRDGRIERIEPMEAAVDAADARTVDCRGEMHLMPGLCDLHIHFPPMTGENGDPAWRALSLLLANGVTTARGMIGHPTHITLRRRVLEGEILGPTIHVAGPPLAAQVAKTGEKAAEIVNDQAEYGFDFIKSHRVISQDVFDGVQEAAKTQRVPVTGHVDNEIGLEHALKTGMQVEHLDGFFAAILTDPDKVSTFGQMPTPAVKDVLDTARIPAIAESIAKAGVWSGPTMALFRNIALAHEPAEKWVNREELRYIMPQARQLWINQREAMGTQGPFQDAAFASWFIDTRGAMLKALHERGGRLLACSDSPQAFLVTGFALHDELRVMVDAGIPAHEVLKAATANAAEYFGGLVNKGSALGLVPDFGRVEVGRRADLLLIGGDPIADIDATRRIQAVMIRGKLLDRTALDAMLIEIEESVKG